jgi:hypothetical protein
MFHPASGGAEWLTGTFCHSQRSARNDPTGISHRSERHLTLTRPVIGKIAANSISTRNGGNPVVISTPPSSPTSAKPGLPPQAGAWTREVAISKETLRKIWELIEAEKANANPPG